MDFLGIGGGGQGPAPFVQKLVAHLLRAEVPTSQQILCLHGHRIQQPLRAEAQGLRGVALDDVLPDDLQPAPDFLFVQALYRAVLLQLQRRHTDQSQAAGHRRQQRQGAQGHGQKFYRHMMPHLFTPSSL